MADETGINSGTPTRGPSSGRAAGDTTRIQSTVNVEQNAGQSTGVRIEHLQAELAVLQTQTTEPRAPRVHAPPTTSHDAFFGRATELQTAQQALDKRRPVLVHGLAGIGKTALASQAAHAFDSSQPANRVVWVSDIGIAPVSAVCDAVARSLGDVDIPKLSDAAKPDATRELLAAYPDMLIALDHLSSQATASTFRQTCLPDHVALMVTSREWHAGFVEVTVGNLEPEAKSLFRDRAGPEAASLPDDRVIEVCGLLEYHPLAVVIAASRMRAEKLPISSILRSLTDEKRRLHWLRLGTSDDRNSSVWASLNGSYTTLSTDQQYAFLRLAACFGDTVAIDLLAEICSRSIAEIDDAVGALVARSFAQRSGERVGLQHLVRDFGRNALGDQLTDVQNQILDVIVRYVERNAAAKQLDHLEAEIRTALGATAYAMGTQAWDSAIRLTRSIGAPRSGVLGAAGLWSELVRVNELRMDAAKQSHAEAELAVSQLHAGLAHHQRGEYDTANGLYLQSLNTFNGLHDDDGRARVLHNRGMLAADRGQYGEASRLLIESLTIKKRLGNSAQPDTTLTELGRVAQARGRYAQARAYFRQSLGLKQARLDEPGEAICLYNLGQLAYEQGDYALATNLLTRNLYLTQRHRLRNDIANARLALGRIAHAQGRYAEASAAYADCRAAFTSMSDQPSLAAAYHDSARLAHEQSAFDQAKGWYEDGLRIQQRLQNPVGIAIDLRGLGRLAVDQGELETGRQLLGESLRKINKVGDQLVLAQVRHELGRLERSAANFTVARKLLHTSLRVCERLDSRPYIARNLEEIGAVALATGDRDAARAAYARSLELYEDMGSPRREVVRLELARSE